MMMLNAIFLFSFFSLHVLPAYAFLAAVIETVRPRYVAEPVHVFCPQRVKFGIRFEFPADYASEHSDAVDNNRLVLSLCRIKGASDAVLIGMPVCQAMPVRFLAALGEPFVVSVYFVSHCQAIGTSRFDVRRTGATLPSPLFSTTTFGSFVSNASTQFPFAIELGPASTCFPSVAHLNFPVSV